MDSKQPLSDIERRRRELEVAKLETESRKIAAEREALERDLVDFVERFNRADDGTMVVPSDYLEVVAVRR